MEFPAGLSWERVPKYAVDGYVHDLVPDVLVLKNVSIYTSS